MKSDNLNDPSEFPFSSYTQDELRTKLLNCSNELQLSSKRYQVLETQHQILRAAYIQLLEQQAICNTDCMHQSDVPHASTPHQTGVEAVMMTDIFGTIISVNQYFTEITGYSAEEVIGKNPKILNSGRQDKEFYQVFWQSLIETGGWSGKLQNRRKNGEIYTEWLSISATRDSDDRSHNYIAIFTDLSKVLESEKRLAFMAYHDALTGLPNRVLFQDRLSQLLTLSLRTNEPLVLIFLDLDNFKEINDSHGHQAGDNVLKEVAIRLINSVRISDTVARLGGDEFIILAPGLSGNDEIRLFCHKVIESLKPAIIVNNVNVFVSGSFGCAEYLRHGVDAETLLNHADIAMYRAKLAGGNTCCIYESKSID